MKTILSLFDYSGIWPYKYKENGYKVILYDLYYGNDVLNITNDYLDSLGPIYGILAAPPCTDFALSGARHWSRKDSDGSTQQSLKLIYKTLEIVKYCNPHFWALENPKGRLHLLVPELGKPWYFHPYYYGDPYTKQTALFGKFNTLSFDNYVMPLKYGNNQSSPIHNMSGITQKRERSMTPFGFAKAFYEANK